VTQAVQHHENCERSDLCGVSRLIAFPPEIDSHSPARGQAFGSQEQYRPAPATHIQDPFFTAKVELVEQLSPDHELATH
jgi:hypothetical protein